MSGSRLLTEGEKREMRADARDAGRRAVFAAARRLSQKGTLEEYIDFLSANMELAGVAAPRRTATGDFRL